MVKTKRRKNYRKKQKKPFYLQKKRIWAAIVLVVCTLIIFLMIRSRKPQHLFKIYAAFGIAVPSDFIIHGIDVSRHQGLIDWNMVKEINIDSIQIGFAFIKATEGLQSADPQFTYNWSEAKKANIRRGAYHFFLPDRDGSLQAKNFIRRVSVLTPGDLPPVVDIETLNGTPPGLMRKELKEFITAVEAHYGVKPIIYTFSNFYKTHLQNDFPEYPLWIAHYKLHDRRPMLNREWQFWQHSETANISGINVPVDMNVFYGDSLLFYDLLVK